jgi:PST family polysaccharide transporter
MSNTSEEANLQSGRDTRVRTVVPEPHDSPVVQRANESTRASHRHFNTDHLRKDLRGRSVRGGAITVGSQAIKFALTMGSTAVLARLLTPDDFGLIAMVAAVVGFASLFKDLGLSMATVQRETITQSQVSTLFWINVAVSAILALLVAAASPLIALLYGEPRLIPITIALGATFIFGGLAAQHMALLQRQMRFASLATIEVAALVLAVAVAITLAALTRSYWALVAMTATQSVATMSLAWLLSRWTPGRPQWDTDVRGMLAFGGHLTGFNTLNYFTRNFDNVLIGAVFGAGPLGLYSRAYNLLMLPIRQINGPISGVVMPALSALQRDDAAFRRYFVISLTLMTAVSMPLVVFAMAQARPIVLILLGEQWEDAVPIFLALGPAAFMGAFNVAPGWLYMAKGRTRALFQYGLVAAPITVLAFIIGSNWGPVGVAWGFSIAFTACYIAIIPLSCKGTPVLPRDFVAAMWRSAASSAIGAGAVVALGRTIDFQHLLVELITSGSVFAFAFVLAWLALPGGRSVTRELLRRFRPSQAHRLKDQPHVDP